MVPKSSPEGFFKRLTFLLDLSLCTVAQGILCTNITYCSHQPTHWLLLLFIYGLFHNRDVLFFPLIQLQLLEWHQIYSLMSMSGGLIFQSHSLLFQPCAEERSEEWRDRWERVQRRAGFKREHKSPPCSQAYTNSYTHMTSVASALYKKKTYYKILVKKSFKKAYITEVGMLALASTSPYQVREPIILTICHIDR